MKPIELALGPCLFNWSVDRLTDFYARIADEAPVDRVYLGEVVCGKRMPFNDKAWPDAIERLQRGGKKVILSSLALPATPRERKLMKELADSDLQIEVNDMSMLAHEDLGPFVAGPFLNIYNDAALRFMASRGADTWCPPVEVSLETIGLAAKANPEVDIELFAFGRLPLALSSRCYHARAHGVSKDSCQFVCDKDPDGMAVTTLDKDAFLAVNGIQTLSDACQVVALDTGHLVEQGITRLRLSPQTADMVSVAKSYRAMLDGSITPHEMEEAVEELPLPGPTCNAYIKGEPGWKHTAL